MDGSPAPMASGFVGLCGSGGLEGKMTFTPSPKTGLVLACGGLLVLGLGVPERRGQMFFWVGEVLWQLSASIRAGFVRLEGGIGVNWVGFLIGDRKGAHPHSVGRSPVAIHSKDWQLSRPPAVLEAILFPPPPQKVGREMSGFQKQQMHLQGGS